MADGHRPSRAKERLARVFQRAPWLVSILVAAVRGTRTRFSAGVVGVVLNAQDEILLVQHVFHPKEPWGLPGGWMERNEAPSETLRRELREETGLEVSVLAPVLIQPGEVRGHLDIAFLCRARNDVQHLSTELLDYRWTTRDKLPPLVRFHREAIEAACPQRSGEGIEG